MRRSLLLIFFAAIAAPAAAVQPAATAVDLTNFKFTPADLNLHANAPTLLQLRNRSAGGHSFSAPAFFAAAKLDPASASLVHAGRVEVPSHSTVQIALVPTAGRYPLKCLHTLHATFGMKGTIVVR